MIPAFALIGFLAAGQQANEPQVTQSQAETDTPVVTCEVKNPGVTSGSIQFNAEGVDLTEWLKRFRAQVQRNWFRTLQGHDRERLRNCLFQRGQGRKASEHRPQASFGNGCVQ